MIDIYLFSILNNLARKSLLVDDFLIFITHFGIFFIIALILLTKNKQCIKHAVFAFVLAVFADQIINLFIYRPRPFVDLTVNLLVEESQTSSFPSGHTLRSFALASSLWIYNKKYGSIALAVAFLIGFSRVFLGVHYPGDILGGIIVGVGAAIIVTYINKQFKKQPT